MKKYNLGKFNIKNGKDESIMAVVNMDLNTDLEKHLKISESGKIGSSFSIESEVNTKVIKFATSTLEFIEIDSEIDGTVLKIADKVNSEIEVDATSISSLLGTDNLQLNNNLSLKQGQVLEIDLCDLTVTIDGENAVHILSDSSDWFDLLPGENELSIETNGESINTDIYWKDRWL
ncbi:MAG: phage distal tail protein [Peptoniphilaceae bacterium]